MGLAQTGHDADDTLSLIAQVAQLRIQMKELMGNGQPGLIKDIQADLAALKGLLWKLTLAFAVIATATGSGTISLKSLLGVIFPAVQVLH